MITLDDNRFNEAWTAWGDALRKRAVPPRAIVCVSAHWYIPCTAVTAMARPKTIHDFGGFPQALVDVRYPAPGDPVLAARVRDLLAPVQVFSDDAEWGLDHGTKTPRFHYELAKRLSPLRDEGVLIAGSGNIVHNLRMMKRNDESASFDWAVRFNTAIANALNGRDHDALIDFDLLGEDARLSVPSPEHYLPLLYIAALQREDEKITLATDEIVNGSLSMLSAIVDGH